MGIKQALIIGGGNASRRYVESLVWDASYSITLCGIEVTFNTYSLAREFALPYIPFRDLDDSLISLYDVIILCLPQHVKLHYLQAVLGYNYNGTIILEKPLAISLEQVIRFKHCFQKNTRIAVACIRDFFIKEYWFPPGADYQFSFYSFTLDMRFNVIHQLPHILSLLISCGNNLLFHSIDNDILGFSSCGNSISIRFHTGLDQSMRVNDIVFPAPNYRLLNRAIVNNIMDFSTDMFRDNQNKSIQVSYLIDAVLSKIQEYEK